MTLLASSVPSLHWGEALLRLALAAAMGGAIGIERVDHVTIAELERAA